MLKEEWIINLITKEMKALSFKIDIENGTIKEKKEVVLVHAM